MQGTRWQMQAWERKRARELAAQMQMLQLQLLQMQPRLLRKSRPPAHSQCPNLNLR